MRKIEVKAIHLGQKIKIKDFLDKYKYRLSSKEPHILSYPKNKHIAMYRYGVVVFWNFNENDVNEYLGQIAPFIVEPLQQENSEITELKLGSKNVQIEEGTIYLPDSTIDNIRLVSEILSRSTILEYFENQVEGILSEFGEVIERFSRTGRTNQSARSLLKKVGVAMRIQHLTVSQMALLDRPDITWDDPELSEFYNELTEEYEIDDRYSILSEKLKILFHDVEFIVNYLEGRRSMFLEVIIILLIMVEVGLFIFQLGWLE